MAHFQSPCLPLSLVSLTTRPREPQAWSPVQTQGTELRRRRGPAAAAPRLSTPLLSPPLPAAPTGHAPYPCFTNQHPERRPWRRRAAVRSQLAPGPLAAPRPPPPRMKAAPQLARLAQRARRGGRAGPSGERAPRACLPRARSLPLRLRPGRGRGGRGGGAQGAGLLRQGRGAGRSGAR